MSGIGEVKRPSTNCRGKSTENFSSKDGNIIVGTAKIKDANGKERG